MLVGALPAIGEANSAAPPTQSTTDGHSTSKRDSYIWRARDVMRERQQKPHGLGEPVKVKGQEATTVTDSGLNAAWTTTRAEEHELRIATADDRELAKASFK